MRRSSCFWRWQSWQDKMCFWVGRLELRTHLPMLLQLGQQETEGVLWTGYLPEKRITFCWDNSSSRPWFTPGQRRQWALGGGLAGFCRKSARFPLQPTNAPSGHVMQSPQIARCWHSCCFPKTSRDITHCYKTISLIGKRRWGSRKFHLCNYRSLFPGEVLIPKVCFRASIVRPLYCKWKSGHWRVPWSVAASVPVSGLDSVILLAAGSRLRQSEWQESRPPLALQRSARIWLLTWKPQGTHAVCQPRL